MKDKYHERLDEIQDEISDIKRDLGWIIRFLVASKEPVQPPPFNPTAMPPTVCSKCKIDINGSMNYACQSLDCPMRYTIG